VESFFIVLVGSSMAKGVPTPDAISNKNLNLHIL